MQTTFRFFMLGIAVLFLNGCSKSNSGGGMDSDAMGYICRKCNAKFYTSRNVFADHCSTCQSPDIAQAVAFYCEKDKHLTVTARTKVGTCEKCNEPLTALRLPLESNLIAWGASKKTASQVK